MGGRGTEEQVTNPNKWTHWDLNPGPSACEADVIPLHHAPGDNWCVALPENFFVTRMALHVIGASAASFQSHLWSSGYDVSLTR